MRFEHLAKVHPVQLVAGENQHIIDPRLLNVAKIFADSIGGSLIPIGPFNCLLHGKNFDKPAVELVEQIRLTNMPVQTDGIKLRQQVNPVDIAPQAIGNGDIDQPVFPRQRRGRFRAELR
jgi:hypothetical protein